MRIGIATLQSGRRAHLERQADAVRALCGAHRYLVVTMDGTPPPPGADGLAISAGDPERLPLARARNRAIAQLSDCDLVIMLDVDCIPDPAMVTAYAAAAARLDLPRALLLGPVGWLSAVGATPAALSPEQRERARETVKRDFPLVGHARETRPELFWSLSFAVSPTAHRAIGGFDESYCGWGAEDTDYGRRAAARGIELWKVGGAWAYHQPHPPARRTSGQIDALAANAARFRARWGDWPMPDVLAELARAGRIAWSPERASIEGLP